MSYLNDYIQNLAGAVHHPAEAEQVNAQRQEHDARERLTPLEHRLKAVLREIPESLQREGLSLPTLQTMLRGRWRGNAHPGDVGRALKHLGFRRERKWRGEAEGFKAIWILED